MNEIAEAAQTVSKMSPPMLIIVCAGILNIALKPFLPERYLMPIATVAGAAVAPYMFGSGTLAYDVPSPTTALVLIGAIMGFIGSVLHRRVDRYLRNKFGNGHTQHFTRADATRSDVGQPRPDAGDADHTSH